MLAAHEYLHHVRFTVLDDKTKQKLTSDLIAMYGNDDYMHKRMKEYANADAGILQPTELFSYYCTESSDRYLRRYVLDACKAYIDRDAFNLAR